MAQSPSPRYYKDRLGLKPRWRLFFVAPRWYLWLRLPRWFKLLVCRWNDRGYREADNHSVH